MNEMKGEMVNPGHEKISRRSLFIKLLPLLILLNGNGAIGQEKEAVEEDSRELKEKIVELAKKIDDFLKRDKSFVEKHTEKILLGFFTSLGAGVLARYKYLQNKKKRKSEDITTSLTDLLKAGNCFLIHVTNIDEDNAKELLKIESIVLNKLKKQLEDENRGKEGANVSELLSIPNDTELKSLLRKQISTNFAPIAVLADSLGYSVERKIRTYYGALVVENLKGTKAFDRPARFVIFREEVLDIVMDIMKKVEKTDFKGIESYNEWGDLTGYVNAVYQSFRTKKLIPLDINRIKLMIQINFERRIKNISPDKNVRYVQVDILVPEV